MDYKFVNLWIPAAKIHGAVQTEAILFVILSAITSFILYKLFLGRLTPERHKNLRSQFKNLIYHSLFCCLFFGLFFLAKEWPNLNPTYLRIAPYFGLFTIISASVVFVKTCRIIIFEYLFFRSMTVGVPLLLVNIFTLALSIVIGAWLLSSIFEFRLLPLVATSAVFSIVLGLALQDTLGNLFSGIALQLDKPYSIGDWVEIYNGGQKLTGLVTEITWRATVFLIELFPNLRLIIMQLKPAPLFEAKSLESPTVLQYKSPKQFYFPPSNPLERLENYPNPWCW